MKINYLLLLLLFCYLAGCKQGIKEKDYMVKVCDSTGICGYVSTGGDTIIPVGKYSKCFTDTFRTYAIVAISKTGLAAIDRDENILYNVFLFDNGPDYISGGLFRILKNNKIGFADSATGKIIIEPQFSCAYPFENGLAKVSLNCTTQSDGEHSTWLSDSWFYVDKKGRNVDNPGTTE